MTQSRLFVLHHLEREPRLTARQLAVLRSPSQRPYLTTKELPQGYSGITRLLTRMVEDGQIRVTKIHQNAPQFFHLPETKAPTLQGFQHELAAANIYVAYDTTGKLEQWHWEPHEEYLNIGLKPDRVSSIDGKIIFWEVDRGTEVLAVIREKVERYIQLSKLHPERRFHVAFAASKGRAKSILLDVLMNYRRGNQFLACDQSRVLASPLDPVFASPLDPAQALSITDLDVKAM